MNDAHCYACPKLIEYWCRDEELTRGYFVIREPNENPSPHDVFGVLEPIFFRQPFTLYGPQSKKPFKIAWGTILNNSIKFVNLHLQCKLQVTARAKLTAENCIFEPYDAKCESAVEIFANSKGYFQKCTFKNGGKATLVCRDNSYGKIEDCTFQNNSNTSLLVMGSKVNIHGTEFVGSKRFSIYLYNGSQINITKCSFLEQSAKAVFLLNKSVGVVRGCNFNKCWGGAISIADESKIWVTDFQPISPIAVVENGINQQPTPKIRTTFSYIKNSSIHALKSSEIHVWNCDFSNCEGNGVNFEYSLGDVYKCNFKEFSFPAIAVFGPLSNPIIMDSVISNVSVGAVVARDCSSPHFINITIKNVFSHAFSVSDYSHLTIEKCKFKGGIRGSAISCSNGAFPEITECEFDPGEGNLSSTIIESFCQGKPKFFSNIFKCPVENILKIHHCGLINKIFRNNTIKYGGKEGFLVLQDGDLYVLDDEPDFEEEEDEEIIYFSNKKKASSQVIPNVPFSPVAAIRMMRNLAPVSNPNIPQRQEQDNASPTTFSRRGTVPSCNINELRVNIEKTNEQPRPPPPQQQQRQPDSHHVSFNCQGVATNVQEEGQLNNSPLLQANQAPAPQCCCALPREQCNNIERCVNNEQLAIPVSRPLFGAGARAIKLTSTNPNQVISVSKSPNMPPKANEANPPPPNLQKKSSTEDEFVLFTPEIPQELAIVRPDKRCVDVDKIYNDKIKGKPVDKALIKCMGSPDCQNPVSHVCIPCGHKVICEECAARLSQDDGQKKFCPLCNIPVLRYETVYNNDNCVICLENGSDSIVIPCGHQCICFQCATQLWVEKRVCPICQAKIISTRHMFPVNADQPNE